MAADIFLHLDSIKGESRDTGHKDWMECLHVDLGGVLQPGAAVASSSGHTVGRCHHHTVDLFRLSDLATPILLQACSTGRTLPKARIELMRADGAGAIPYFVVELEHVLVAAVSPGVSEGQPMGEFLTLAFGKVKWSYAQQKIGGGIAGRTSGGWDLTTNTRWA